MSTLYLTQDGTVLRKRGERLRLTLDGEELLEVPLIHVEQVVVLARASITPSALWSLLEHGIDVAYLTTRGRYLARLQPAFSKNAPLRRAQYRAAFDPEKTLALAKVLVRGKLGNLRTVLRRSARFSSSSHSRPNRCKGAFQLHQAVEEITRMLSKLEQAEDVESVRGYEGAATAAYFRAFPQLIKAEGFQFPGRVRRPPTDPVNALLSFGYTLLHNDCLAACQLVGFDPYVGYLHAEKYGRAALALDLMEEFRPVLVDSLVLTVINKRQLAPNDFREEPGSVVQLEKKGLKAFLQAYEKRKRRMIRHPLLGTRCTYRQALELQARILAKTLLGELPQYVPFLIK